MLPTNITKFFSNRTKRKSLGSAGDLILPTGHNSPSDFLRSKQTPLVIDMVTEGTYPQAHGGVSVWCDQLLQGLPEYQFNVHAVAASSSESSVWKAPANLRNVNMIGLWGDFGGRTLTRNKTCLVPFEQLHQAFLEALLNTSQSATNDFVHALFGLHQYGCNANLDAALTSRGSVERLVKTWRGRWLEGGRSMAGAGVVEPSLADAMLANELIAHLMRPLSASAPKGDLVHAVSNGLPVLVALNARWTHGTPFVLTEHGIYLRERYLSYTGSPYSPAVKALLLRFYRMLSNTGYMEADLITPGSDYNRRWELLGGAHPERIQRVYNGVDTAEFPTGLEPTTPTISWLGRIDPIKDVDTLIRAFAYVHDQLPESKLRVFGGTPKGGEGYHKHCQNLIKDLNLTDSAILEGRVDVTVDAYHAGHVVALTSISEGFPYTAIEAMAAGRPLVATDVGGVREAIGETGFVVPPRDPEAVARASLKLLTDHPLRQKMGAAARDRVFNSFTLENFLGIYRTLYREVADKTNQSMLEDQLAPSWSIT
jgi:polysaccharide biosynthesis protein PelF